MTFSIVAHCPRTGQLGVAVSTAVPAVGAMCPYIRAGVGASVLTCLGEPTAQTGEDGMDRRALGDEGDDAHLAPALRAA